MATAMEHRRFNDPGAWVATLLADTETRPETALALFVLAIVSMGGFLFSHTLSIDDELTLFAGPDGWLSWFNQGRFLIGLLQRLVPQPVTPLFPYVLLACCYVVSYILIIAVHGLRHRWTTHLGFLIFILFPTNWLSQEFVINVPGFGVGLVLVSFAAYITARTAPTKPDFKLSSLSISSILLLILAIGGFQSLITLYLSIGAGNLLFRLCSTDDTISGDSRNRPRLSSLVPWFANGTLAVVLHSALLKLYLAISHTEVHQIDRYFRSPYFMLRTEPQAYIHGNISQLLQTYLTPGLFYGHSLWALTALLAGFPLVVMMKQAGKKYHQNPPPVNARDPQNLNQQQIATLIALAALLLLLPLSLNIISKPYRIPMRALMALPYLAWLASSLWLRGDLTFRNLSVSRNATTITGALLSGILVFQCLICSSNYYAARAYNFRSDQLVAASIAAAITQAKNAPSRQVSYLASQGSLKREVPYSVAMYSTAGSSFFNWDGGNDSRMVTWLKAMGISHLKPATEIQKSLYSKEWEQMSVWPAPGSIVVRNDTILIKFNS
jgi:hypothetical protein